MDKLLLLFLVIPCILCYPEPSKKSKILECHDIPGAEALDYLATKRHYKFDPDQKYVYTPDQCHAVKFWYFGRHGTRYPGDEDIIAMQEILPRLQQEILGACDSQLCPPALEYFSSWRPRPDVDISRESFLHEQGKHEVELISSRYISRYPTLFPKEFANSTYFFKFTNAQRTNATAHAFVSKIFDEPNTVWFPPPLSKDPVLKFYSMCPKWEKEVDENPESMKEHDLFVKSLHMNQTIERVSRRAGLQRNLTLDELTIAFTTCAFETAWDNGTISQWCSLFGVEDLAVMEYREDLEYYWKDGYGYGINYEQACSPFKDAIAFFDEYPGEQDLELDYRKTQAYFSHSGATLKMFARLGLFNNTVLKADNFESIRSDYEWKTSRIDTMATNMAFVMYQCNTTEIRDRQQIGLFVQEVPTPFTGCGGKPFCSYEEFRSNLSQYTEDCDLEKICKI